ncbi:hypothetical protein EDD36DRAFT_226116 [Exophiala viscosa]|uniref:Uncharacterized protein n=1 Tax=Exophiala viscosa TaxID=2486360 RepID=A0AAN6IEG2_9EURO|nr:hypothetical protein EDD36DRAFT_226116 [Exophiala viscosa]
MRRFTTNLARKRTPQSPTVRTRTFRTRERPLYGNPSLEARSSSSLDQKFSYLNKELFRLRSELQRLNVNLNIQMKGLGDNLAAQFNTLSAQLNTFSETQAAKLDHFENRFLNRMAFAVGGLQVHGILLSNNDKGVWVSHHRDKWLHDNGPDPPKRTCLDRSSRTDCKRSIITS